MAPGSQADDAGQLVDRFLARRGHTDGEDWERDFNKKQCPECRGLHELSALSCSVCGWAPAT